MYGDEVKFGGGMELLFSWHSSSTYYTGKTIREGMGQATDRSSEETVDLVITNALIIDWSGIYKVCTQPQGKKFSLPFLDTSAGRYRC